MPSALHTFRFVLAALVALAAGEASAAYDQPCWLRYKNVRGWWSPLYSATCTYMTGAELNARFATRSYQRSKTYALVGWGYAPATAIRISETVGCLFEADKGCADRLSHKLHGLEEDALDANGHPTRRTWLICQPGIGRGCDPGGPEWQDGY